MYLQKAFWTTVTVARWRCWLAPRCSILPRRFSLPRTYEWARYRLPYVSGAAHARAAAARLDLVSTPEIVTWYTSLPQHSAPSDSFSLHRAGRAPPIA